MFAILLWCCPLLACINDGTEKPKDQKGKTSTIDEEQDPNLDGVVEVSFKIDNSGKVQIININSTSTQLAEYVMKKLSKIQLHKNDSPIGKIIHYRFVFKKQA